MIDKNQEKSDFFMTSKLDVEENNYTHYGHFSNNNIENEIDSVNDSDKNKKIKTRNRLKYSDQNKKGIKTKLKSSNNKANKQNKANKANKTNKIKQIDLDSDDNSVDNERTDNESDNCYGKDNNNNTTNIIYNSKFKKWALINEKDNYNDYLKLNNANQPKILPQEKLTTLTPFELFKLYFTDELFKQIFESTNHNLNYIKKNNKILNSVWRRQKDITLNEIKLLVGVQLFLAINHNAEALRNYLYIKLKIIGLKMSYMDLVLNIICFNIDLYFYLDSLV